MEPTNFAIINQINLEVIQGHKIRIQIKNNKDQNKQMITKEAIFGHSKLLKATREAKMWSSKKNYLTPRRCTANDVYALGTKAFFKVGAENEEGCGVMETLIWDLAVLLAVEKLFVPTGETKIYFRGGLPAKSLLQWNQNGKLRKTYIKDVPLKGSIQPTQKGCTLDHYIYVAKTPTSNIARLKLIHATAASILFGMYDTHGMNIFVTTKDELKFFDNTRSLPNGNRWIHRDKKNTTVFRSSLLELPEMYEPLNLMEHVELTALIEKYNHKMSIVRKYFESWRGQRMVKRLPPGWLNLKNALTAMRERLFLMEISLENPKINNLRDLIMTSIPSYRFSFAITTIHTFTKKLLFIYGLKNLIDQAGQIAILEQNMLLHRDVGHKCISQTILKISNHWAIDFEHIKKLSESPKLSSEEMIKDVIKHVLDVTRNPPSNEIWEARKIKSSKIISWIFACTVIENKDLHREYCEEIMKNFQI